VSRFDRIEDVVPISFSSAAGSAVVEVGRNRYVLALVEGVQRLYIVTDHMLVDHAPRFARRPPPELTAYPRWIDHASRIAPLACPLCSPRVRSTLLEWQRARRAGLAGCSN